MDPHLLPAIDRYDGPAYRVLRRSFRTTAAPRPDTYIISAEFGLLPLNREIPAYDRLMTPTRARQLRSTAVNELSRLAVEGTYDELFICMGRTYLLAIDRLNEILPPSLTVHVTTGSLGRQLGELYEWLNGSPPPHPPGPTTPRSSLRIRGVEVTATASEALAIARRALHEGAIGVDAYHSWYVRVDDRRVAPKWLVSQLTGLSVSAFSTGDARRLLSQLGVDVWRMPMTKAALAHD